ncbi:MAG: P63C domain-containing protein [Candidatus Moranbacteria bacterium]|nr:P63C domain-containing protein [Candidatus Moranbacteria bacterium]
MEERILKATHHGLLKIGDTELNCSVLEDGSRIISRNAIFRAFKRTKRGRAKNENREPNMPAFIDAKNLKPYISSDLLGVLNPLTYIASNGRQTTGFKAEILPLLCDTYLQARDANALLTQQQPLATIAEILVRSLSKVGIVALVDEATGYQDVRKRDELQQILKAYISEELLPWTKRFPDEFYMQMFRLKNLPYDPSTVKRPSFIGKLTNKLIYEKLPPGVLKELKTRTPKSPRGNYTARFHQSLTEDIGHPTLKGQLQQVIVLMRISPNWRSFERNFVRAFGGQQDLGFESNDE